LSDALSAKLPAAKLKFSGAGIFECFPGTVVVGPDVRGVMAKVRYDTAPAGSEPPVWSKQHVHRVPDPFQNPLFRLVYEGAESGVPVNVFNEKPLLAGNVTMTSSSILETRSMVTTHWVALDATHVTFNEPWAEAVATYVDAPMTVPRSAATAKREEIPGHLMRAS
jgi:hypothetical protein